MLHINQMWHKLMVDLTYAQGEWQEKLQLQCPVYRFCLQSNSVKHVVFCILQRWNKVKTMSILNVIFCVFHDIIFNKVVIFFSALFSVSMLRQKVSLGLCVCVCVWILFWGYVEGG